jgi:protocatechuate 3,4-dioxygenase, alpha subunit
VSLATTPSQTIGPFFSHALPWPDGPFVVPEGTPGAVRISGRVLDGAGEPVPDAMIETWQADPDGRFAHPDDPRGERGEPGTGPPENHGGVLGTPGTGPPESPAFRGFGRCHTDDAGRYQIVTVKPGPLPTPGGGVEAPHLDVSVFARGLGHRLVTRVYFPDEAEANAADPVLSSLPDPAARATLVATADGDGLRFDVHLQGAGETVFFDV